jgi:hypothetical protein
MSRVFVAHERALGRDLVVKVLPPDAAAGVSVERFERERGLTRPHALSFRKLVAGATKEGLDLHSHSAMRVCQEYDKARRQHRKPWLRWRGRRSLGWVPFNTGHVRFDGEDIGAIPAKSSSK